MIYFWFLFNIFVLFSTEEVDVSINSTRQPAFVEDNMINDYATVTESIETLDRVVQRSYDLVIEESSEVIRMQTGLHPVQMDSPFLQTGLHPVQPDSSFLQTGLHPVQPDSSFLLTGLHTVQTDSSFLQTGFHPVQPDSASFSSSHIIHILENESSGDTQPVTTLMFLCETCSCVFLSHSELTGHIDSEHPQCGGLDYIFIVDIPEAVTQCEVVTDEGQ